MAQLAAPEQTTATWVVDQLKVSRHVSGLYEARFGKANPHEAEATEAFDSMDPEEKALMAAGKPLPVQGIEAIEAWAEEEKRRLLGKRAFEGFMQQQDARIATRLQGALLTVAPLGEDAPAALFTHPDAGGKPIEESVTMVFQGVRSQDGRLGLGTRQPSGMMWGPRSTQIMQPEPEVHAYIVDEAGKQQLGLDVIHPHALTAK